MSTENTDNTKETEESQTETEELEELEDSVIEESSSEESVEEDPYIVELKTEIKNLKKDKEELTTRLYAITGQYQEKAKEVNGMRARLERQMKHREAKTRGDIISSIFEPYENLKRSVSGFKQSELAENHIQALEMVQTGFWTALQKLGLEEIPGKGSFFDPNIHEALTTMPVMDPNLNNIVIEVYATGYRINDIVVKPSSVIVGMYTPPPEEKEENENSESISEAASSEE